MNRKIYNALERTLEKEGKSNGTYREYFANIKNMEQYFEGRNLKEVTIDELSQYVTYLDEKYNKRTYNNHIAALRYLYKKVIKRKYMLSVLNLKRVRERIYAK